MPSIHNCVKSSSESKLIVPNLILLAHFFNNSFLEKYKSESEWVKAHPFKIPHIKFDKKAMATLVNSDKRYKTGLSKIVRKMKKNEEISENDLFTFSQDLEIEESSWDEFQNVYHVLALTATLGCTMLWVIMVGVIIKLRKVLIIIALLVKPQVTRSQEWKPPPTPAVNTMITIQSLLDTDVSLHVMLVGILGMGFLMFLYKKSKRYKSFNTELYLHISSSLECQEVRIAKFTICPRDIVLTARMSVTELRVVRHRLRYELHYVCTGLQVIVSAREVNIPNRIPISCLTAWKVRRLLRRAATAFFLFKHNGVAFPIAFE